MTNNITIKKECEINASAALAVQRALINEIYPEMRKVIGCLNHIKKLYRFVVICHGKVTEDLYENMDAVFTESLVGVPSDYDIALIVERIDFPSFQEYNVNTDDWYFFIPFARHEEIEVDAAHKVTIKLE